MNTINALFANDIYRRIEEVIKVDQTNEEVLRAEIEEYVVTRAILGGYTRFLDRFLETPNKPHEGIAVWVSGFFGSGKSSFAKILGLVVANRAVKAGRAADIFTQRSGDPKLTVLLKQINERIPTEAVIFDVSSDRGIRSGNQTLTEIIYRLFLKQLGYADDLDLAELEITLEEKGELDAFKAAYRSEYAQEWDENKDLIAMSLGEAGMVVHKLHPERFATPDSWAATISNRADITPARLADRCKTLMDRRRPGQSLVVVVDEVGQFVAHDVQKMLDLQAVVQNFGRVGRGKLWLVVTSQEKLNELVGGLDDKRIELARLMDRFPQELQVHLEPSDISEVTSRRILAKNADAETSLRQLYEKNQARLSTLTKVSADIQLPELTAQRFVDLYPLLPYQVDLIIQIVSGLRSQKGGSKHVGGANRTIIKLAQQLLIHDGVGLAKAAVGKLVRLDQIYDLVSGNIASELRSKINDITSAVPHHYALPVAKAICLLQFVQSVHRTADNIAAVLLPSVDADAVLSQVKEALAALEKARFVRQADGQYRIPTPAEDDWETSRAGIIAKPMDIQRIHARTLEGLWEPRPSHNLQGARSFKAGLLLNARELISDDLAIHVTIAEPGDDHDRETKQLRSRSQSDRSSIFWVAASSPQIRHLTDEVHRSAEILQRKERGARTNDETALVSEERQRLAANEALLRALLRQSLLGGVVFFRGNERVPDAGGTVAQAAATILGQALPEIYNRFAAGAASVSAKDLDALLTTENLRGLPQVVSQLHLLIDQKGRPAFAVDSGPLKEVLDKIEYKTGYGEAATGQYLTEEFGREPYGWSFDVVRLFAVALLRAGVIKAVSGGARIDSALSVQAKQVFPNNNLFKKCSFQRAVSTVGHEQIIEAETAFKDTFGISLPALELAAAAASIRQRCADLEEHLREASELLLRHRLPGGDALQSALNPLRLIRTGGDEEVVTTFIANHKALKDGQDRATDVANALTEPRLADLARAKTALAQQWPVLAGESDTPADLHDRAKVLADLLQRETFFRDLPAIDQHATAIGTAYNQLFDRVAHERQAAYQAAVQQLTDTDGFDELNDIQRTQVAAAITERAKAGPTIQLPIAQIREETAACSARLQEAQTRLAQVQDGNRLVTIHLHKYISGRITTVEQLSTALRRLEQDCQKQLANNKTVLIQ